MPALLEGIAADKPSEVRQVSIAGLTDDLKPRQTLHAEITSADGKTQRVPLICRIDTLDELEYFRNGGILAYVLRQLAA